MNKAFFTFALLLTFISSFTVCGAQQITGAWKGTINNQRVEMKIIQKGDSLNGTSYYYGLTGSHKRYSIKGYFESYSNSVVWWDDELITAKGSNAVSNNLISVADFNCPGSGRMFLDGKSFRKEEPGNATGDISLTKVANSSFHDEWDFVLDNYHNGANDPYIIDSVGRIATARNSFPANPVIISPVLEPPVAKAPPVAKTTLTPAIQKKVEPAKLATIDELFITRKKILTKEIPIEGDSVQLHFYDNAEVDGDSITLYLNNKMIFTHVRLTASPYVVTLQVKDLAESNELVMVAENLGSIPPNTALMIAMVGSKRYEAYLESTEGSSSLIRFTKKN
jgi:hypothetical protein